LKVTELAILVCDEQALAYMQDAEQLFASKHLACFIIYAYLNIVRRKDVESALQPFFLHSPNLKHVSFSFVPSACVSLLPSCLKSFTSKYLELTSKNRGRNLIK